MASLHQPPTIHFFQQFLSPWKFAEDFLIPNWKFVYILISHTNITDSHWSLTISHLIYFGVKDASEASCTLLI